MNFVALPDDWPTARTTVRLLARRVAAAQRFATGDAGLIAVPGGIATSVMGPDRRRVRFSGGSILVEADTGLGEPAASVPRSTTVHTIAGSTLRSLIALVHFDGTDVGSGVDVDENLDLDAELHLDADAVTLLGDWFALGQRALDATVLTFPDPAASVVAIDADRLAIEVELDVDSRNRPGRRTRLGASAGDATHQEPYLFVAPLGDERPGPAAFWNVPSGARLSFAHLDTAENPLASACEFFLHGVTYQRM